MNRLKSILLKAVLCCSVPLGAHAQTIELQAITDFTSLNSGEAPYYLDIAGGRNALAINAANPDFRDIFARAEHEFTGPDGIYNITIKALGEIDGNGTYRLSINGIVQGVSVNEPVNTDYTVIDHVFEAIALTTLDVIAVESNAVTNNTIPEGDGYAFARGRWRSLLLEAQVTSTNATGTNTSVPADESADLGITLSTVDSQLIEGGQAPFIVSVTNLSTTNTATTPVINISLPEEISFNNSADCAVVLSGIRCLLPNIAPQATTTVSFVGDINAAGWIGLIASASADQADDERGNNTANLSFQVRSSDVTGLAESASTIESVIIDEQTGGVDETAATVAAASNAGDTKSGAMGVTWLAMLLLIVFFRNYKLASRAIKL